MSIKVSVIIPVYKVEEYLKVCVDSVLNQTYQNIEVILVDDGSPDNCPKICDDYAKADERVVVIHKQNAGVSKARETGANAATGDYVMYIDSDDWIDLDTIETCVDEIIKRPTLDCVLFSYTKENIDSSRIAHTFDSDTYFSPKDVKNTLYRRLWGLLNSELNHPERLENLTTCWMKLYRKELTQNGRYVDVKTVGSCEDGIFNMYALYDCKEAVYIDKPMYHYRRTANSLTSTYRPQFIKQWGTLFSMMENIIDEKQLDDSYKEALNNRIALSITAVGLNELSNKSNNIFGHIKEIRKYLKSEKYRTACKSMKTKCLPITWKVLMICSRLKLATLVYFIIKAIRFLKNR